MNKILIIEDEDLTGKLVQERLSLDEITADIATDGKKALQKLDEFSYDLILLDLKLPDLDGKDVLKEIRRLQPFIDVVIYSNSEDFLELRSLTNIGIDGFVSKGPTAEIEGLISVIKEKLYPMDEDKFRSLIVETSQDIANEIKDD